MAFNVINMKHREAPDLWLHIKDENDELMYADDKKKKPVRVKFKSIHGEVFRKAFLKMNVRLSRLKNGKQKEYEELAEQKEIREQIREEEKARREMDKAIKDAEKEERLLQKALEKVAFVPFGLMIDQWRYK